MTDAPQLQGVQVVRRIGKGGMGKLYLVTIEFPEGEARACVLKTLRDTIVDNEEDRANFVREAMIGFDFSHGTDNLLTTYGLTSADDGRLCLLLEYVDGYDVDHVGHLFYGNFPVVRAIAHAVLNALYQLYRRGIVHRDVSPGNILIGCDGTIKLIDLGRAVREEGAQLAASHRKDLARFGRMLYQLVTKTSFHDLKKGELPFPDDVPGDLEQLIRILVGPDPDNLFTVVDALALLCEFGRPVAAKGDIAAGLKGYEPVSSHDGSTSEEEFPEQSDDIAADRDGHESVISDDGSVSDDDSISDDGSMSEAVLDEASTEVLANAPDALHNKVVRFMEAQAGNRSPAERSSPASSSASSSPNSSSASSPSISHDSRPLTRHYLLGKELGHGGMAVVRLAHRREDDGVGDPVAIKFVAPKYLDDMAIIERFQREAQISLKLDHECLIYVHQYGLEGGEDFIVMERIEGLTLDELRKQTRLTAAQVRTILAELLSGLGHAHKRGILHRDIKPTNIMISRDGEVKLIDFGLAKDLNEPPTDPYFKGTAAYAAAESLKNGHFDESSDLYSLGAVSYYLITGKAPHGHGNAARIMNCHRTSSIAPLPDNVPGDLRSITTALLVPHHMRTFRSADHVTNQWCPWRHPLASRAELGELVQKYMDKSNEPAAARLPARAGDRVPVLVAKDPEQPAHADTEAIPPPSGAGPFLPPPTHGNAGPLADLEPEPGLADESGQLADLEPSPRLADLARVPGIEPPPAQPQLPAPRTPYVLPAALSADARLAAVDVDVSVPNDAQADPAKQGEQETTSRNPLRARRKTALLFAAMSAMAALFMAYAVLRAPSDSDRTNLLPDASSSPALEQRHPRSIETETERTRTPDLPSENTREKETATTSPDESRGQSATDVIKRRRPSRRATETRSKKRPRIQRNRSREERHYFLVP